MIKLATALAALLPATGQALAHTGDHSHLAISEMGAHLASWPDHLAILLIAAFGVLIALGAKRLSAVKRRK
ncbi:MAG: hypothetical protein RIA09_10665 [Hoeflea sp.]|uniref:hypothetical protein n=1 Tax=Hoeflea sp. TaxID=1940281 RepID=UPI0032ED2870